MTPNKLEFFKVSSGEMLWNLLTSPSASWHIWILTAIGCVAIVAGAILDIRVMVLGLLICLSLVPPVVVFMYYSHVLDTYMIANILNHTVERCPGGYRVRIFREESDEEAEHGIADNLKVEKDSSDGKAKDSDARGKRWIEAAAMTVYDAKVTKRRNRGAFSVLYLEDSPVKVLYVPNGITPSCHAAEQAY